jgi:hypothetical protein
LLSGELCDDVLWLLDGVSLLLDESYDGVLWLTDGVLSSFLHTGA